MNIIIELPPNLSAEGAQLVLGAIACDIRAGHIALNVPFSRDVVVAMDPDRVTVPVRGEVQEREATGGPTLFGPLTLQCPNGWAYPAQFDVSTQTFRPVSQRTGRFVTVCDCNQCSKVTP